MVLDVFWEGNLVISLACNVREISIFVEMIVIVFFNHEVVID
jgi:hypothetical protein